MSWWMEEIEPYEVVNYLTELFEYDHGEGRLRWTEDRNMWNILPASMKRRAQQGAVAGTTSRKGYDYEIKIDGTLKSALPLIWEHQTTNCKTAIMTIKPGETRFSIDNLCLIPSNGRPGKSRAPKARAAGKTVVSWSHERKKFTVVKVDNNYNKMVLSYHDLIEDAIDALKKPEVSFL